MTILAIGGLLMPVLVADRYKEKAALGLVTSAVSLGLLFPPCLPLVLYAIIAHVPIEQMFLGGIIPGAVMLIATAAWGLAQRSAEKRAALPLALVLLGAVLLITYVSALTTALPARFGR